LFVIVKAKLYLFFEVQIKLEWTGKASSSDGSEISGKGVIIVDNIANDEPKWKVTVRMESETSANRFIKAEMNSKVGPIIDNIVNAVLEDMKAKVQDEGSKLSSPSPSNKTETAPAKTPEKKINSCSINININIIIRREFCLYEIICPKNSI